MDHELMYFSRYYSALPACHSLAFRPHRTLPA
jgi:hypothetical protein